MPCLIWRALESLGFQLQTISASMSERTVAMARLFVYRRRRLENKTDENAFHGHR